MLLSASLEEIQIVSTAIKYADSFNAAVDSVARERKYIGFVEGPPLEGTRHFIQSLVDGSGIQMLAVTPADTVVGWCDIIRNPHEGFRHVGRLGMGLLRASNTAAIALYRALGFVTEGTKRRARKLDGEYDDNVVMALLADTSI